MTPFFTINNYKEHGIFFQGGEKRPGEMGSAVHAQSLVDDTLNFRKMAEVVKGVYWTIVKL
ncbi:MAG TPA: hypothetical protein VK186_24905 [Candidatus Deferrimicrobium sp.]|nr:hypothetical protein [Candidatus Deferrimicrobium sp.]